AALALLRMRSEQGAIQNNAAVHASSPHTRPHPEEPAEDGSFESGEFSDGGRLEGWGPLRFASLLTRDQSPRMNASFLARDQPFTCRSASMASVMVSKCSAKATVTGRRFAV